MPRAIRGKFNDHRGASACSLVCGTPHRRCDAVAAYPPGSYGSAHEGSNARTVSSGAVLH